MFMKKLLFISLFTLISLNSSAFDYDNAIHEIDDLLSQYGVCTGDGYSESDFTKFSGMFSSLKKKKEEGEIKITDATFYTISLKDSLSGIECTMHTDPYDGRCNFVLCD